MVESILCKLTRILCVTLSQEEIEKSCVTLSREEIEILCGPYLKACVNNVLVYCLISNVL